jgi:hypothetical protein
MALGLGRLHNILVLLIHLYKQGTMEDKALALADQTTSFVGGEHLDGCAVQILATIYGVLVTCSTMSCDAFLATHDNREVAALGSSFTKAMPGMEIRWAATTGGGDDVLFIL